LYVGSGTAAFADLSFALMPFIMLRNVAYLDRTTKTFVAVILGMGAISGVAVLVRIPYIRDMSNGPAVVFSTIDLAVWTIIEPGYVFIACFHLFTNADFNRIGMFSANLACLRPLFRKLKNNWSSGNYSHKVKTWVRSRSRNSSRTHIDMTPQPWNTAVSGSDRYSNDTALSEKPYGRDGSALSPNALREQASFHRMVSDGLSDLREMDDEDLVVQISRPHPSYRLSALSAISARRDTEEYCRHWESHDIRSSDSLREM